jgi:hypothetical protein
MYSNCFEELDLEKNLIGDMAGKDILDALEHRKETGNLLLPLIMTSLFCHFLMASVVDYCYFVCTMCREAGRV